MIKNPITVQYNGTRPLVKEAVLLVNQLFQNIKFYEQISTHTNFSLADISPVTISNLLMNAGITMKIDLYYAISPLKNIDGYDDHLNPENIHLNIWRLDRSVASICNSIVHACVHAVNSMHHEYFFGHTILNSKRNIFTAPYAIGTIAQKIIAENEVADFSLEHEYLRDIPPSVWANLQHCDYLFA